MGTVNRFQPENLVVGVLFSGRSFPAGLEEKLAGLFGPVDYRSPVFDFNYTEYYNPEMGPVISRCFYSFERTVDPSELSAVKLTTNRLEEDYAESGLRKVNLDPGLLDLNRLVLATTKNVGHRIPLNEGIYGEVTLIYMKKDFHPLEWTYPDYRSDEYRIVLKEIRQIYKSKLNQRD